MGEMEEDEQMDNSPGRKSDTQEAPAEPAQKSQTGKSGDGSKS